jgi:hypothetical protein
MPLPRRSHSCPPYQDRAEHDRLLALLPHSIARDEAGPCAAHRGRDREGLEGLWDVIDGGQSYGSAGG